MSWRDKVNTLELVYASTTEDKGFRTWSLKKTTCNVSFYESYLIDDIDKIICSILEFNDGCLAEDIIATILGFNVVDDFDVSSKRYADKAELDIFRKIVKPVFDWGLVERISEKDKSVLFKITELGYKALAGKTKYKFYTGEKILFENSNIKPEDMKENIFFPFFSLLGVYSEITQKQQIQYDEINLTQIFDNDEPDLIKRHNLQSKEIYHIYKSEKTRRFTLESCQVDIRLLKNDSEYYPIIFCKNQISIESTELLYKPENTDLKEKKIEWGLYLKLIKDPNSILDYKTIIQFEDLLELDSLIKDNRLIWDDTRLFDFIAERANANQWFDVSIHCSIDVIKLHLDKIIEKLDWTSFSLRIDNDFLVRYASNYPWNFEAISARNDTNIEVIKTLLLIPELKEQDWDWESIMPQLDFDFIKSNIDRVDFELFGLTKKKTVDVHNLIIKYPTKRWDWLYISAEYDLSFILDNILSFQNLINLKTVLDRSFISTEYVNSYCDSVTLKKVLTALKDTKLKDYSANQSNYYWTTQLIYLLEEVGCLTWESGSFVLGFECNPYIEWDYHFFKKHREKLATQRGYDFVSERISDYQIVLDNMSFDWNWDIISANSNLISNSEFILSAKNKLNFKILLSNITGEVLESIHESANVLSYLETNLKLWPDVTEKYSIDFIRSHIDYNWDWKIITKRFCSSIKLGSLGNPKWIDKWDWEYLTGNLDLSELYDYLDLYVDYWDWRFLSQKFEKDFILENLPEYNAYWDWEILLNDRLEKQDFQLSNYLPEIAACLSVFEIELTQQFWQIITRKFDYDELGDLIAVTYDNEVFNWDYRYFYELPNFNPLQYIDESYEIINWTALSSSSSLNDSLKWDKSLFSYEVWLKNVLKLLKNKNLQWNFKELSKLDSINWNGSILSVETVKWDWNYLSEYSPCFKVEKDFEKRFHKFSKYINFQIFSKRTDSAITEELLDKTIDKNWDWGILSSNKAVKLSLPFISNHKEKPWNWQSISINNEIKLNNKTLFELSNQQWDWLALSKRTDIDFSEEFIIKLQDKPFDWYIISQNKFFIPNAKTLSLIREQKLAWDAISQNPNLSLEILWDYRESLNWYFITKQNIVDFTDISFLEKYQDYLDWDAISQSERFSISFANLKRFKNYLNWGLIISRNDFSINEEMLAPFADVLNWSTVSKSFNIDFTEELIEKFRSRWDWQLLIENPQIIEKLGTTLRKYQAEFNCVEFLEKFDRTPYIYHYTHLFTAIDIIKERRILSRNKAKELGLLKYDVAGNVVDRTVKAHPFARFYFRPLTPTQFYNECLGHDSMSGYLKEWTYYGQHHSLWKTYYPQARNLGLPKCPIPVFFKVELKEVLMKMPDKCNYSTGNMQTNWARVEKVSENPKALNTHYLYSDVSDYENYKQYSQQEFLIEEEFDFSLLDSFEIICYNEEYANLLKGRLGNDPICKKINANGCDVFNRSNRELIINENEDEISIISEYRDNAYLSITGAGIKNIHIYNMDNIKKETENEIIAYPEIRFSKTSEPIEVYFVDKAITTKSWLVYSNHTNAARKNISFDEFELPNKVMEQFKIIDKRIKLKLSKNLFFSHMVNSYHGIAHTTRVLFGACLLLQYLPDIDESLKEAIYYSAIIHDLGKTSDTEGAIHGAKSAELYKTQMYNFIPDAKIQSLALSAIKYHSVEDRDCPKDVQNNIIWKVLKDADALDRGRFSKKCDNSYLRLDIFETDIGNKIVSFMDKLSYHTRDTVWNNPYTDLVNCIKQINS